MNIRFMKHEIWDKHEREKTQNENSCEELARLDRYRLAKGWRVRRMADENSTNEINAPSPLIVHSAPWMTLFLTARSPKITVCRKIGVTKGATRVDTVYFWWAGKAKSYVHRPRR